MTYFTASLDATMKAAQDAARAAGFTRDYVRTIGAQSSGYVALARTPDSLIAGAVTRNADGAATSAPVVWPDGQPGTYTALVLSSAFPGAVDSYKITYGSPVVRTYTQPTVTRDASGAAVNVPAITVT